MTTAAALSTTFLRSTASASSILSSSQNVVTMPHNELSQHHRSMQALEIDADHPEEEDADDELWFDFYESPCLVKASNDEFSYSDIQAFSDICNQTFYGGCQYEDSEEVLEDVRTGAIVEALVVFDYEVWYDDAKDPDPIPVVDHLETILLDHLGTITGLNECGDPNEEETVSTNITRTNGYDYRRQVQTREYAHDFSFEMVVAVSGAPKDQLSVDHAACIVPVPSSVSDNADCIPVTGKISLYLNDTDEGFLTANNTRLSIESGFQRLIRFGMQNGLYVSGNVKHTSFIGTRIVFDDGNGSGVNNAQRGGDAPSDSSTIVVRGDHKAGLIIGAVGGVVLVALLIALFTIRRTRNANRSNQSRGSEVLAAGGDATVSSLPVGGVDEENPYLVGKTPLSATQRVPVRVGTARTMEMDLEDDDDDEETTEVETQNHNNDNENTTETVILDDENLTTVSGDELKVFHDDEEEILEDTAVSSASKETDAKEKVSVSKDGNKS